MSTTKAAENHNRQHAMIGYLSVLFAAALFGSVFTLAKVPLATVDPLVLAAVAYTVAGLALIPFAKASFKLDTKRDYLYLGIITITGAVVAPTLLLYGLAQTEASDASILANGEVLFTIILSAIFFGEKPNGRRGLFAVILVIIGLFMATTNLKVSETILQFNAGNIMILASMSMWAIDNNVSRRLTSTVSPAKISMIKSLLGGLVLLAIAVALGRGGAIASIEPGLWLIIIVMAVSGFGGALLLFLQGIKRIGTVKTMSIFAMTPIFGIAIAAVALGESISAFQMVATGLIIAGILIISRH
ncbi:MAG TPA: DMT family transporter [Nitrososphaera sp.]|nr:DMT family transporter [Nitrososphaera sp.]